MRLSVEAYIDVKHISYKWVYKVKTCPHGSIKRYKASSVARGFLQYGLDYDEISLPENRITPTRLPTKTFCR